MGIAELHMSAIAVQCVQILYKKLPEHLCLLNKLLQLVLVRVLT